MQVGFHRTVAAGCRNCLLVESETRQKTGATGLFFSLSFYMGCDMHSKDTKVVCSTQLHGFDLHTSVPTQPEGLP